MSSRLEGKTSLVTGSTSTIGRAIALAFAAEGSHVIVSGRSAERGAEVVDRIHTAGGTADFVPADLDGSPKGSRDLAASDGAAFVHGSVIDVDGGRTGVAVVAN